MSTTKNIIIDNTIGGLLKPPIDRYVNPNCTGCCPQLVCTSFSDVQCDFGRPPSIFVPANSPNGATASPKKLYADSFGWSDNGCDCSNLNASFTLAFLANPLFQTSSARLPLAWGYIDYFCQIGLVGPSLSDAFDVFGNPIYDTLKWTLTLVNGSPSIQVPGQPDFIATYSCSATQFSGCGSAIFTFQNARTYTGGPLLPAPPCCSTFPSTIVVRGDSGDTCNCNCNTIDNPGPDVFYLNAGLAFINTEFTRIPELDFGWAVLGSGRLAPFTISCCNGKLYVTDHVEIYGQFSGSGCSFSGLLNGTPATLTCNPL